MKAILAHSEGSFVIGNKGKLPWHLHMDMLQFEAYTRGKICFMGKSTYESIPEINRTRLKGRDKVIMSHKTTKMGFDRCQYWAKEYIEAGWFFERMTQTPDRSDVILIGGKSLYEQFIPYCDEIMVTCVNGLWDGDIRLDKKAMLETFKQFDHKCVANIQESGVSYSINKLTRKEPLTVDDVPPELRPVIFPIKTYDWWSNRVK